ncbi:MAG: hypothetical protein LUE27_08030 [Clostridia bacterium]|nr:hypothetical protein [Clostridia bacterium]
MEQTTIMANKKIFADMVKIPACRQHNAPADTAGARRSGCWRFRRTGWMRSETEAFQRFDYFRHKRYTLWVKFPAEEGLE